MVIVCFLGAQNVGLQDTERTLDQDSRNKAPHMIFFDSLGNKAGLKFVQLRLFFEYVLSHRFTDLPAFSAKLLKGYVVEVNSVMSKKKIADLNLLYCCSKSLFLTKVFQKLHISSYCQVPQQDNGYDCGVYMLLYARMCCICVARTEHVYTDVILICLFFQVVLYYELFLIFVLFTTVY